MFDAAVAASAPGAATARSLEGLNITGTRRVWVFAFGKAAGPMASAAVGSLLRSMHSVVGGIVVEPHPAGPTPYPTLVAMGGDHPIPGTRSFLAAAKIAEITAERRGTDIAVVLLSGGASSLIAGPLRGMNASDLSALYELLLGSGLDIAAMNTVRKRFSRWGAGRLALALAPTATYCLAVSDVPDEDVASIGSGPCLPDTATVADVVAILERANLMSRIPATYRDYLTSVARHTIPETPRSTHPAFAHITTRVVASNRVALDGADAAARARGLVTQVSSTRLGGEAARAGENFARMLIEARRTDGPGRCLLWGGETSVTLGAGSHPGGGGRCQELALAAARVLDGAGESARGITVLAAGTDGRDGETDAAGAVIDASTWRAIASSVDPGQALAAHESNAALRAADALIPRRDTGTNVNDIVIGLT